jgi:DNA-binding transcriptional regulator PaaX
MYLKTNSLSSFLIAFLSSSKNSVRFYQIMREKEFSKYNENSVRVALSRLSKNKYIQNDSSGWFITSRGSNFLNDSSLHYYIKSPFKKELVKNTIVAFDISEKDRKVRMWLRNQLKIFDYVILQKSLWFGPGPLPKEFIKRLVDLGIRENVKIFTIRESKK